MRKELNYFSIHLIYFHLKSQNNVLMQLEELCDIFCDNWFTILLVIHVILNHAIFTDKSLMLYTKFGSELFRVIVTEDQKFLLESFFDQTFCKLIWP